MIVFRIENRGYQAKEHPHIGEGVYRANLEVCDAIAAKFGEEDLDCNDQTLEAMQRVLNMQADENWARHPVPFSDRGLINSLEEENILSSCL